jgi:hypothetical protein
VAKLPGHPDVVVKDDGNSSNNNTHTTCAGRGRREADPWARDGRRSGRRRKRGCHTHWMKCPKAECGAEMLVWFDPKGTVAGSLGNGVLRIDVWKVLTSFPPGEQGERSTEETRLVGSEAPTDAMWARRTGCVEEMWREKGRDVWSAVDSGLLDLFENEGVQKCCDDLIDVV